MCVSDGAFGQASKSEDLVGYAFALVFLQEVGSTGDFHLFAGGRNELAELLTGGGEREYRVGVGECHQSGLGPTAQGIGDGQHGVGFGGVFAERHQQRELCSACLGLRRGEGRIVGGNHLWRQSADRCALNQVADGKVGSFLRVGPPGEEALRYASGEQTGVEDREIGYRIVVFGCPPQSNGSTPVLHDDGGPLQVEVTEHGRDDGDVAVVAVPPPISGLVGPSEAGVVHGDDASSRRYQRGDHLAVQVGPGGFAV